VHGVVELLEELLVFFLASHVARSRTASKGGRRFATANPSCGGSEVGRQDRPQRRVVVSKSVVDSRCSDNFCSGWNLPWHQKRLYQFAFTANGHSGKSLEPLSFWNVWFLVQPISERSELISGNPAFLDSIEQMIEQCGRKILPPNLRHCISAASRSARPLPSRLNRPCRGSQPLPSGAGRRSRGQLLREPSLLPLDHWR
jgi:hypothetical protein